MKKQINHISIYQSSKLVSLLGAFTSAIFAIPLGILLILSGEGNDGLKALIYPFVLMLILFVFYAIFFAMYNFVARHFGGIELEFKDIE